MWLGTTTDAAKPDLEKNILYICPKLWHTCNFPPTELGSAYKLLLQGHGQGYIAQFCLEGYKSMFLTDAPILHVHDLINLNLILFTLATVY